MKKEVTSDGGKQSAGKVGVGVKKGNGMGSRSSASRCSKAMSQGSGLSSPPWRDTSR